MGKSSFFSSTVGHPCVRACTCRLDQPWTEHVVGGSRVLAADTVASVLNVDRFFFLSLFPNNIYIVLGIISNIEMV